jgi:hypothetical protein
MHISLPEKFKIVEGDTYALGNATMTLDNVSLKNVQMAWIVLRFDNNTGGAVVVNPLIGTNVTTCATAITFNADYWYNADTGTTDTLVKQTSGTTFTTDAGATDSMVIVRVDPAAVAAQGATYDCLGCTVTGGAQAGDFWNGFYILETRYPQATPPAAISN